jgi:hypothetical protein
MNYLAIGLIIVLLVVIYYFYSYMTNPFLTSGLQDLKTPLAVTYDNLKNPNSPTYSYQCWLYISSPTANNTQIFCRGENAGAKHPDFEVDINGQTLLLKVGTGTTEPEQIMTITTNFPIQKWTHLVINVYNLKTFEAYINGKLAKTVNTTSNLTPSSKTNTLYIGNVGLNGYVTKFIRKDTTLDANTVWQNYLSGNGLSNYLGSMIPYGLNLTVSKGEELQRVINVF